MATRPAAQFISLDTLVARARPAARPASTPQRPPPGRTLADLERASSIAPAAPSAPPTPVAIALWITIRHCACGTTYRCPPDYALVKYAPNEHSIHYARGDISHLSHLPIEVREKETRIPLCEACCGGLRSNQPTGQSEQSEQSDTQNDTQSDPQ